MPSSSRDGRRLSTKGLQSPHQAKRVPLSDKNGSSDNARAGAKAAPSKQNTADRAAMSTSDILSLYTSVLKLSTENKINQKNSWSLGLIDHMDNLCASGGAETDFQRASATLEASTKIYSCRVDSVHTETYRVLGGLTRGKGDNGSGGGGTAEDGSDDEEGPSKPRKTAVLKTPTDTLEADPASLTVKKFDLGFDIDPLFHKTSASFDEGGAVGMLVNNLCVGAGCALVFDSTTYAPGKHGAGEAAYDESMAEPVRIGDLVKMVASSEVPIASAGIWPAFRDFMASREAELAALPDPGATPVKSRGGAGGGRIGRGDVALGVHATPGRRLSLGSEPPTPHGCPPTPITLGAGQFFCDDAYDDPFDSLFDMDDGHGGYGDDGDDDSCGGGGFGGFDEIAWEGIDHSVDADNDHGEQDADFREHAMQRELFSGSIEGPAMSINNNNNFSSNFGGSGSNGSNSRRLVVSDGMTGAASARGIAEVVLSLADAGANEYRYFDPTRAGNWAGPSHWKRFARPAANQGQAGNDANQGQGAAEKPAPRTKKPVAFIPFLEEDGTNYAKAFAAAKPGASVLAKAAVEKATEEDVTLPDDLHISVTSLARLFTRPSRLVSIVRRPGNGKRGVRFGTENGAENGTVENDFDDDDRCGAPCFFDVEDRGYDSDDGGFSRNRMDGAEELAMLVSGAHGGSGAGGMAGNTGSGGMGGLPALGIDLVEAPRKVGKINISYAKIAKKMDVKVLKDSLWDTLTDTAGKKGTKAKSKAQQQGEDNDDDGRVVERKRDFAEVITELPMSVPDDIMENVSVPFCFICLLHLANEHQLEIESGGLGDLKISQPV